MKRILLAALALAACGTTPMQDDTNPLVGGEWIEATRALRPPTITFTAEGAAGFAGCNRWFASYERAEQTLRFSQAGATRMACEQPAMQIEQNFLSVIDRTRSYRTDGETLVLLDEAGAELARFLRAR